MLMILCLIFVLFGILHYWKNNGTIPALKLITLYSISALLFYFFYQITASALVNVLFNFFPNDPEFWDIINFLSIFYYLLLAGIWSQTPKLVHPILQRFNINLPKW